MDEAETNSDKSRKFEDKCIFMEMDINTPEDSFYKAITQALSLEEPAQGFSVATTSSGHGWSSIFQDRLRLIHLIRKGIPYKLFDLIRQYSPFSDAEWAVFLGFSAKSMLRYKQDQKVFKPLQSEKILSIAEVSHAGMSFFGDEKKFHNWLFSPSFALGNHTPAYLLADAYGKELVLAELMRLEHGIFI